MKGTYLGEFEELVLLTIGILGEGAYGVAIKEELERQAKRKISIGAVHASTNRLVDKGYLEYSFGEATKERGGKRKKLYRVTIYGQKALKTAMDLRKQMWGQIDPSTFSIELSGL